MCAIACLGMAIVSVMTVVVVVVFLTVIVICTAMIETMVWVVI